MWNDDKGNGGLAGGLSATFVYSFIAAIERDWEETRVDRDDKTCFRANRQYDIRFAPKDECHVRALTRTATFYGSLCLSSPDSTIPYGANTIVLQHAQRSTASLRKS